MQIMLSIYRWSTAQGHETINFGGQKVTSHEAENMEVWGRIILDLLDR